MSIRFKLTTTAIAVILVANSLFSFVTLQYLSRVWMNEVQNRVLRNISAARAAYQSHVQLIAARLEGAALDRALRAAVERRDQAELAAMLRDLGGSAKMDFAVLLDPAGKVICRGRNERKGDDYSADPLVARVHQERRTLTGTVIFSRERLLVEGEDLAARARFDLVPTPAARPTEDRVRSDGMVSAAAVPVRNDQGQMLAILYGGDLLNRRDALVDSIKQQVYHGVVYRGKDIGTVTIFQGDLRIATNVMMGKDRAVGTRLSAPVCEEVLDRGGTWAAPAFVVNDWYITAYEPIRDPAGRIIGALYVGILQAPYIQQRNVISGVFLGAVLVASLASLTLVFLANHLVLRPIRHVLRMAQRVIAGDLTARVGIRPPGEMGALCQAIDAMAQAVAQREELLQQATRRQIGRSEQLASVGRLAAGVAHEINNPLTGVLAFADLLRQKENMDEQDRQDLEVIVREAIRAREIVRGLLDYARETPSAQVPLNANEAVVQVVKLLGKREAFQHIVIVEDLAEDLPLVNADRNQLEQVLVNLSLNACEAMPNGGTLMLATSSAHGKVVVEVTDTGCGISKEHLDRIFEPFFTTKPVGKGTGLGLSVSYGIVRQHGGALEVESQEGKGSTFKIILPALRGARGVGPSASPEK